MMNKPKNVITTVKDTHNRKTVLDFIPIKKRIYPIGRLDKETTGLVLITNDGELANFLMHPSNTIPRIYNAVIEGKLNQTDIKKIEKGIYIGEGEFGRGEFISQSTKKKRSMITLRLFEGKKREVRRIFRFLKKKLYTLHRTAYGNINLGNLKTGCWRKLTIDEMSILRK